MEFQFLIDSLESLKKATSLSCCCLFQFLIDSLESIMIYTVKQKQEEVSIPYR